MGAPSRRPASPKVMDVGQLAEMLGYPREETIRAVRAGEVTPPIVMHSNPRRWRFSTVRVERDLVRMTPKVAS